MEAIGTFMEFQKHFDSEESCYKFLLQARWPNGFECPQCGHHEAYELPKRKLFQCKACKYQASVTANTILHKTHLPLRVWFWAIYLVGRNKQGFPALQLQRQLGIGSYGTAWHMAHRIRSAMADKNAPTQLFGLVEMDDAYFGGKRSGKRGRGAEGKTLVAVAIESRGRHAGRAAMAPIPNASTDSLSHFAEDFIQQGSQLITDGWLGYAMISSIGFEHNAQVQGLPEKASKLLPWVHILIGNLKNWIRGIFHHVSTKHLFRYLTEYLYRFNRRWKEEELFSRITRRCLKTKPLPYSLLIAEQTA
jgi:hypothetical protein